MINFNPHTFSQKSLIPLSMRGPLLGLALFVLLALVQAFTQEAEDMPKKNHTEIQQKAIGELIDRCVVDQIDFEMWCEAKGYTWQGLANGTYGLDIEQAQMLFVLEDPCHFVQAFMDEPDSPGTPYKFWDYQKPSVRSHNQDVVHQDGAEVGKTREIISLIIWGQITGFGGRFESPSMLVAAPQQTHLDEIIGDLEIHFGVADGLKSKKPFIQQFWLKPKKSPHYQANFLTIKGTKTWAKFRPGGHDGSAFRGVHANAMGIFDEAAKAHDPVIFSEFTRGLKPHATERYYSVPDGRTDTRFYELCQQAIPDLKLGQDGHRKFHWSKTQMPDPFWSPQREKDYLRRYGSRAASGYQRNVLGLHGSAENPVFPLETMQNVFFNINEYVTLKLVADGSCNLLRVERYNVAVSTDEKGKKFGRKINEAEHEYDLSGFVMSGEERMASGTDSLRPRVRELLAQFLPPGTPGDYHYGCDLGFSTDPSEIFINKTIGNIERRIARINLQGLGYDLQQEIIYLIDERNSFQGVWGVDFGNAGTAVVQNMKSQPIYLEGDYTSRLTGFTFSRVTEQIDEDGNYLEQEDKRTGEMKTIKVNAKQLATELINARLQKQGYEWAPDPEVVSHFQNHTSRENARGVPIYDKKNDHTIDAQRTATLAKVYSQLAGGIDVFSGGVYERRA